MKPKTALILLGRINTHYDGSSLDDLPKRDPWVYCFSLYTGRKVFSSKVSGAPDSSATSLIDSWRDRFGRVGEDFGKMMLEAGFVNYDLINGRRRRESTSRQVHCEPVPRYCAREFVDSLDKSLLPRIN